MFFTGQSLKSHFKKLRARSKSFSKISMILFFNLMWMVVRVYESDPFNPPRRQEPTLFCPEKLIFLSIPHDSRSNSCSFKSHSRAHASQVECVGPRTEAHPSILVSLSRRPPSIHFGRVRWQHLRRLLQNVRLDLDLGFERAQALRLLFLGQRSGRR